ncbi:MAG: hypothetical protein GY719_09935 [bacterium]|nr:hypothetical protein [bacterium]
MDYSSTKRLNRTEARPVTALEKGWFRDPRFLKQFFDRCEHRAFVLSPDTLALALRAVEFAERHGAELDGRPCLLHRSYGVLSHAYIVGGDLFWAGKVLNMVRDRALACCPPCRSEFLRREGDLLGEQRQAEESLAALNRALEEGADHLDADARARIYYVRAVAYHFLGYRARALADAGRAIEGLSLTSPRGYFLDLGAFVPIYVAGGGRKDDRAAERHLQALLDRVKGKRPGWPDLRGRVTWAGAQVSARLDDYRAARRRITSAYVYLLQSGLAREITAATTDRCILVCRGDEPHGKAAVNALKLVKRTLERRPDLDAAHREGLGEMQDVLDRYPENAFEELVRFRRSFIAPVPGVMAERLAG